MKIAVAGATGKLGTLVIDALLSRGAPAGSLVALGRSPQKLAALAAKGVETRVADYNAAHTLVAALEGVDRLLLISGSDVGHRIPQHENIINAARRVNVSMIAYTSIANARTGALKLAAEHVATEDLLAASGIPYVLLRNGWYTENYTDQLMGYLNSGVILGADKPFTLGQLAGALGAATGQEVTYRDLDPQTLAGIYEQSGIPKVYAEILVDTDVRIRDGALEVHGSDLARLIGHAPTSLGKAIKQALDS